MVDFDKFEKNVKNNYGNQEFPFDEQNWEKAAKMIDDSRKGKNRGGIFLLSAVGLLFTSALVYYFGFSDGSTVLQKNELTVNQTITANEKISNGTTLTENDPAATSNNNSNEENIQSGVNTTSSNENVSVENGSNDNASEVKTNSKNNATVNNSNVTENISNTKSSTENNTSSKNETKAETKPTTTSANTVNETRSNNTPGTEGKKTTPIKSNVKSATPPVLGSNTSAYQNTVKPVAPNTTSTETGSTEKLGSTNNNSETPTKNNVVIDSTTAIVTTFVDPIENRVVDSVPPMRKSKADSLAAMQPKGDGVSYATNVKEKHNAKNILFMEAGTTYLLGWNGGGKNEAGGFNLLAGINLQHYFTGSIAAQIGVQYSTISNLTNTTHTISTVNYDLGMEQDVTSIHYQKLHYVVAPVKVTYNIGDKNIVGIGCNIGYLLNSDSKKENYKTYSSDPNAAKNNLTSTKESGYVQGFNPLDIQVGVSYRRKIYKGLSANAEFFYGLTDTKDNNFFKSNYFDRNVGFKVSLCYDLFKK
jgi:hypothetical protein